MDPDPVPLFRPSKRQRIFRSRPTDDDNISPENSPPSNEEQETLAPRFRRPGRKLGLLTTTTLQQAPHRHHDDPASPTPQEKDLLVVSARFAPPTGLVKDDTDKHM
jgi:hypothetical protein